MVQLDSIMCPGTELNQSVLDSIASHLFKIDALGTLASFRSLSKGCYCRFTPLLYRHVNICTENLEGVLCLGEKGRSLIDMQKALREHGQIESTSSSFVSDKYIRRALNLRHIYHLTIESLPDVSISSFLLVIAWQTRQLPLHLRLFPKLEILEFAPEATVSPMGRMFHLNAFFEAIEISGAPKEIRAHFTTDNSSTPKSANLFSRGPLGMREWLDHNCKAAQSVRTDRDGLAQAQDESVEEGTSFSSKGVKPTKRILTTRLKTLNWTGNFDHSVIPTLPNVHHIIHLHHYTMEGRPPGAMRYHMSTPHIILQPPTRRLEKATLIRRALESAFTPLGDGRSARHDDTQTNEGVNQFRVIGDSLASFEIFDYDIVGGDGDGAELNAINSSTEGHPSDLEWVEQKIRKWIADKFSGEKWPEGMAERIQDRVRFVGTI